MDSGLVNEVAWQRELCKHFRYLSRCKKRWYNSCESKQLSADTFSSVATKLIALGKQSRPKWKVSTKQKGKGLEFPSFKIFKAVFKTCFVFIPTWGRWTHFSEHIFQMGWFNHQLENHSAGSLWCQFVTWLRARGLSDVHSANCCYKTPKFNNSPVKSYRIPKRKKAKRLPLPHPCSGNKFHFRGVKWNTFAPIS